MRHVTAHRIASPCPQNPRNPILSDTANRQSYHHSSIASFLFPIFASYKALKSSDPAQLTPWLMYWVVFSCCLLAESWVSFILMWCVSPFHRLSRNIFV